MAEDSEKYQALLNLINSTANKELQCREYLRDVPEVLVRETVMAVEYTEAERRGNSGDSDYVISCRVCDGTGIESVKAYVWEVKAPQCYVFEKDRENRLRPTRELIAAENQLLHYHHELQDSGDLWRDFRITHRDNVLLGGIIIGCRTRRVSGQYDDAKKERLYEKAMAIRQRYFYKPNHIWLFDWNSILDLFKPRTQPHFNPVPKEPTPIAPEALDARRVTLSSSG